ncbi:hypothetical protein [Streptomyces sp. NPDC001657]|uniref:hypothetical protein n=1 Tax=Streptomyces sp. NPDC001657 TaxID=3154522 RepID=UPI00332FE3B3
MSPIKPPEAQDGPSGFDPGQEDPPIRFGVWGDSAVGAGVVGSSGQAGSSDPGGTTPGGAGTLGINNENQGIGVLGRADKNTGTAVLGTSSQGTAVSGLTKGVNPAVAGKGTQGPGVSGTSEQGAGVVGVSRDSDGVTATSTTAAGLTATGEAGAGVVANSKTGTGVKAVSFSGSGVEAASTTGTAVGATSHDGTAVRGDSGHSDTSGFQFGFSPNSGPGVMGTSFNGSGVFGFSEDRTGVHADGNVGIFASGRTLAGRFDGDVHVSGTLTQGVADVRIDHPLDPGNRFLSHSSVTSAVRKNVYDGTTTLDAEGAATVELPDYFEVLNEECQYQLTPLGDPAPNLHISSPVSGNRFAIAGGRPQQRVCWQITGARRDAWSRAHPLRTEAEKPPEECGYYLHPEAHGQRPERAIASLHHPEVVRRRWGGEERG